MSGLDTLRQRAQVAMKSEVVEIGEARFRVRGFLLGERNRVLTEAYDGVGKANYTLLYPLAIGLCVTDEDTGKPLFNPNTAEGRAALDEGVTGEDADLLLNTVLRLSGMEKDKSKSEGNE